MQPHDLPDDLPAGANSTWPVQIPPRAWLTILRRVWIMAGFHELGLIAGGLAFYCFLALTPMIGATVMIYGLIGDADMVRVQMEGLARILPPDVAHLLELQLMQIVSTRSDVTGLALVIALLFAIFGAMRAASGMIAALNIINEEHESRGMIAVSLRAAGLTLAAILIALTGVLSGGIFAWLQSQAAYFLGAGTASLFKWLTWGLALLLGTSGFALIMRFGPDRRAAKWRWIAPGAILATLLWLAISFGFSLYVAYISNYNATYGSLSAIVVFLMWLYLSAYGVLLGALFNAEIERQVYRDTTRGRERPPGQRGAVLADVLDDKVPSLRDLEARKVERARSARHRYDA